MLTGGSGFIGRNIREQLGEKYRIFAPGSRELDLTDGTAVRDFLRRRRIDFVIHGAIRPGHRNAQDPSRQLEINTRMFFNLLGNAKLFRKMIFLSSGSVYDMKYYRPRMKEDYCGCHIPSDELGLSKYIAARFIELSSNIVELRLLGIFGKYEDYAIRFISNAICKTLFDLPITLKINRRFDYLYIDDLMPVLEYFLREPADFSCYNVTPGRPVELLELARMVKEISGKDLPVLVAREGMGPEYTASNLRLRKQIPGLHFTPIKTAVTRLYQWYAEHKSQIDRELLLFDK